MEITSISNAYLCKIEAFIFDLFGTPDDTKPDQIEKSYFTIDWFAVNLAKKCWKKGIRVFCLIFWIKLEEKIILFTWLCYLVRSYCWVSSLWKQMHTLRHAYMTQFPSQVLESFILIREENFAIKPYCASLTIEYIVIDSYRSVVRYIFELKTNNLRSLK